MRSARATDAGASISYRSAISKSRCGRILPNKSARLRVAMPMVLAIPTSLSELSRHSMRESISSPSFSISSIVFPNSGDRCDPRAIIFRSTLSFSDKSRNGQYKWP